MLHAKTGIKRNQNKVKRRTNKRKSLASNNSSATSFLTASQQRYKVNFI